MSALWRLETEDGVRVAVGTPDGPRALLVDAPTVSDLLASKDALVQACEGPTEKLPSHWRVLPPADAQEIWAAGVTFEESRFAREEESAQPDFYRDVYFADRPELFLKAPPHATVGPEDLVGIRSDSSWNVPEPELTLAIAATGDIVAYTLGNDVSSRSIEGANPLYLPQAKTYERSCAVGPCLVPVADSHPFEETTIQLSVQRGHDMVFAAEACMRNLRRKPEELVDWLFRARQFPAGALLLTGTGIVPPADFTLIDGDLVSISAQGLGVLRNGVRRVGREADGAMRGGAS